ncbi:MAG TPA: hypothetical protein VGJ66_04955 [Pyrinomonadaceae bacterium]|jgi:hypothetical protein
MRLYEVRRAKINPGFRKTFEQYGMVVMQNLMANQDHAFLHEGGRINAGIVVNDLLPWLTEQHDLVERRENWMMVMEIAIVILVAAELCFSMANFFGWHSH